MAAGQRRDHANPVWLAGLAPVIFTKMSELRVHILYKRDEIPAKLLIPEFAVSVTYRKQEKAESPSSILVSATKRFIVNHL
jgi:hypothetical protein